MSGGKTLSLSPGFTYYFLTGFIACKNVFGSADNPAPLATKGNLFKKTA